MLPDAQDTAARAMDLVLGDEKPIEGRPAWGWWRARKSGKLMPPPGIIQSKSPAAASAGVWSSPFIRRSGFSSTYPQTGAGTDGSDHPGDLRSLSHQAHLAANSGRYAPAPSSAPTGRPILARPQRPGREARSSNGRRPRRTHILPGHAPRPAGHHTARRWQRGPRPFQYYFHTASVFEAPNGEYDWLNRLVAFTVDGGAQAA